MTIKLFNKDNMLVLPKIKDNSIHAVVCDPPYGLAFMQSTWDLAVPSVEFWKEILRILKPGGHVISFFSANTYHLGAMNIHNAGFEIRDMIFWMYASSFPKGKHVKSHPGWHTKLKTLHEPIALARKPLEGTVQYNMDTHNTGALNIDDTRVPFVSNKDYEMAMSTNFEGKTFDTNRLKIAQNHSFTRTEYNADQRGRFTPNVALEGENIVLDAFPEIDGEPAHRFYFIAKPSKSEKDYGLNYKAIKSVSISITHNDKTLFHSTIKRRNEWLKAIEKGLISIRTSGAISEDEQSENIFLYMNQCMEMYLKAMTSTTLISTPAITISLIYNWFLNQSIDEYTPQTIFLQPMEAGKRNVSHVGTYTNLICLISDEEKILLEHKDGVDNALINIQLNITLKDATNDHLTIKPLKLMRHLVKLVTPTNGIVLDPYMGSGTTGKAAKLEGKHFIGIEQDYESYIVAYNGITNTGTVDIESILDETLQDKNHNLKLF